MPQGPAPRRLKPITDRMKKNGELAYQEVSYFGHPQKRQIALRPPNLTMFSGTEIGFVRQTVEKFWKLNATEISDQSHLFLGWRTARLHETIPYSTALVSRRAPTSYETPLARAPGDSISSPPAPDSSTASPRARTWWPPARTVRFWSSAPIP